MERATGTEVYDGCGSAPISDITLNIQTTTGRSFTVSLSPSHTVEHLKKVVSKKLRVSKDRICLLHRERQLRDGTMDDNGLLDGARVILLPSVETGLLSQRTENSVMQALESLNDTQVNDFLSGKSPLNLTMRLGDHMMLIQLQLSTLNSGSGSSTGSRSLRTPASETTAAKAKSDVKDNKSSLNSPQKSEETNDSGKTDKTKIPPHFLQKKDLEMLQNAFDLYRTMAEEKYAKSDNKDEVDCSNSFSDISDDSENDQSPIKSLSNLVSSPIAPSTSERDANIVNTVKSNLMELLTNNKLSEVIPSTSAISEEPPPGFFTTDSSLSDDGDNYADQSSFLAESTIDEYPMESLFNSAVDKGLFEEQDESMMDREISNLATTSHGQETPAGPLPSFQSINEPLKNKRFQYLLHKTSKYKHPIGQSKQKAFMQSVVNKHKKRMQIRQESNLASQSTSTNEPYIMNTRKLILQPSPNSAEGSEEDLSIPSTSKQDTDTDEMAVPSTSKQTVFKVPEVPRKHSRNQEPPPVDTRALIEASKNLTQKLKKLSKEVLKNKIKLRTAEETVRSKIGPGAVIESMKHHGKGIYSGTFSGTLNPALQDRYGRPKRDISTIIHILNDLLCAAPPVALAQKESKHSCAVREESVKCNHCKESCNHVPRASGAGCACEGECTCLPCRACPVGVTCKQCDTAKTLASDNSKTKCKLEQLRLVMQQKKQRREARKLKTLPYSSPPNKEQSAPIQEGIETVA